MHDAGPPTGRLLGRRLRRRLIQLSSALPVDAGGGSSLLKVMVLADLVAALDLRQALEIGVYRGRLFLGLGVVMAELGRGDVPGIDPYSAEAAVQCDDHDVGFDLAEWARVVDWDKLHSDVRSAIAAWGLQQHCHLIRAPSEEAASEFGSATIDLLHVDGNHDAAAVTRDLELYLPKVRAGGLVVLDDVSWPSVRDAFEDLRASHQLLLHLVDGGSVWIGENVANDFAVFRTAVA
jgi:Methyltransferase domain